MLTFYGFAVLLPVIFADVYLHNPRGSNNRLDENRRERNNANRLFDSQNNNRGGYNVGSVYYYAGSQLPVEWTNQHSCKDPRSNCELILQYMCSDTLRDGASTTTIPNNPANCEDYNCNTDREYGMHEDYLYYLKCTLRQRNQGLFTADQNLKSDRATSTRQNPGGTRRGYECPEERDYYPYWGPTPWRDIAIFTNDASRCPYYQEESENVKGRGECVFPEDVLIANRNDKDIEIPITQNACEQFTITEDGTTYTGEWVVRPSHGIDAPVCMQALPTRDNHLGNTITGNPFTYNWTLPDIEEEYCAFRLRYNISTGDYEGWDDVDADQNAQGNNQPANLDLSAQVGLANENEAEDRGFVFENNPQVEIFDGLGNLKLQLAINTAQLGRTFQDRSHRFAVRAAPADIPAGALIHNVNVRGKRGNIVQVYPSVEYDFVPNILEVLPGDYVHFQWAGSNTNPKNNDGQGLAGTDRSNVVLMSRPAFVEGGSLEYYRDYPKQGQMGRTYPESILGSNLMGLGIENMRNLALVAPNQFGGELSELDDAGTYFDLGAQRVTSTGVYHYMCTRNNNFSNRDQKGRIAVRDLSVVEVFIDITGGELQTRNGEVTLTVPPGAITRPASFKIEQWNEEYYTQVLDDQGSSIDNVKSSFVYVSPEEVPMGNGQRLTLRMKVESAGNLETISMNRADRSQLGDREGVDADFADGFATLEIESGGVYMAQASVNGGAIAGIVIAVLVVVGLVVALIVYKVKTKGSSTSDSDEGKSSGGFLKKITRNFQKKV